MIEACGSDQYFAQTEDEFVRLLDVMRGSTSMLEIGSRYGASLLRFAAVMKPGSRIVSIDDRHDTVECPKAYRWWYANGAQIAKDHDVHLLEGNSHDKYMIDRAESFGPYDFIFIDGDHSDAGVRQDWKDYGHFGRIVAFHDINLNPEIRAFFEELKDLRRSIQFNLGHGIGVVFN